MKVYVLKRPHVDEFLKRMGEMFECVLFTASLAKVRFLQGNERKGFNIWFIKKAFQRHLLYDTVL